MPRSFSAEELAARRPVWTALSDLFLDTDTRDFEAGIARTLAASPYSLAELEAILLDEVAPVLRWNVVWWEWAGFDPVWLEERIVRRQRATWRWPHLRALSWALWELRPQWRRIRRQIEQVRRGVPSAPA